MVSNTPGRSAIILVLSVFMLIVSSTVISAFSSGPPNSVTGAPGESNCTSCHAGNPMNAQGGTLAISGLPQEGYTPGTNYTVTVSLERSGQSRWGFEAVVKDSNGLQAGTVTATDIARTQTSIASGLTYIKHTSNGTSNGTWTFDWKAPDTDQGEITIYAAGNAANGNGTTSGDFIYTTSLASNPVVTSIVDDNLVPAKFALNGNYPNPFNPETRISFSIPSAQYISLEVFDVLGRKITSLIQGTVGAGDHDVAWDASNMPSGTYFYRLMADGKSVTKKMLLVK